MNALTLAFPVQMLMVAIAIGTGVGANIAFQGIFQALDSGIESLILSVCRQFLFVIPVAWGLSKLVLNGVLSTELIWITFPVAEGLTVLVAMIFMRRIYCRKIQA